MTTLLTILKLIVLVPLIIFVAIMAVTIVLLGFQAARTKIRETLANADPQHSCLSGDGLDHEADTTGKVP